MIKKKVNILESGVVKRADEHLDGDEGYKIPLVIIDAYKGLKKEVKMLHRMVGEEPPHSLNKATIKKKESDGHHPAVTGLSVGGVKELIDWFLAIATQGDRYSQEFFELSFIDGGITAIIAAGAAWIAKGSRN